MTKPPHSAPQIEFAQHEPTMSDIDEQCDCNEHASAVDKRKAKKKAKRKQKLDLQNVASDGPFADCLIRQSAIESKGLEVVAVRDLEPGAQILMEHAFAFVVRSPYVDQYCHSCLQKLSTNSVTSCVQCQSFHCSAECFNDSRHAIECEVLSRCSRIAAENDTDIDLLRILVRVCCNVHMQNRDLSVNGQVTSFKDMWSLMSHHESADPAWMRVVSRASAAISTQLSLPVLQSLHSAHRSMMQATDSSEQSNPDTLPIDELRAQCTQILIGVALRVNSNAHSLGGGAVSTSAQDIDYDASLNIAFGLFPLTAKLNHSCYPNCHFVGTSNGRMSVRVCDHVKVGQELTVRYIDIYSSREARQQELQQTKSFECGCVRCAEPLKHSVDRFLTGILCSSATCSGRTDRDVLQLSELKTNSKSGDSTVTVTTSSVWKCHVCGLCKPNDEIETLMNKTMSQLETACSARSRHGLIKARSMLEAFIAQHRSVLHRCHTFFVNNALISLMNVCRAQHDWKAAADCAEQIVDAFDVIYPRYYAETAEMLFALCEMLELTIQSSKLLAEKQEMQTRLSKSMQRCLEIRRFCFGEEHLAFLVTLQAAKKMNIEI